MQCQQRLRRPGHQSGLSKSQLAAHAIALAQDREDPSLSRGSGFRGGRERERSVGSVGGGGGAFSGQAAAPGTQVGSLSVGVAPLHVQWQNPLRPSVRWLTPCEWCCTWRHQWQRPEAFAPPHPSLSIYVAAQTLQVVVLGLPYRTQWQDLKDLCRQAGNVLRADIVSNSDGSSKVRCCQRTVQSTYVQAGSVRRGCREQELLHEVAVSLALLPDELALPQPSAPLCAGLGHRAVLIAARCADRNQREPRGGLLALQLCVYAARATASPEHYGGANGALPALRRLRNADVEQH